jgi:ketosteroid isomerase-like protein
MLAAFRAEFSLDIDEVELAGDDWAFERGTYTIALTPKAGGTPIRDTGKYLTIYRRQADHSWLMARDIWNSNNPLPGQA